MRLTQYTDYSFRVLIYLAARPAGELATIREIAERYAISENHLMKVVHQLGRHGFVRTVRGRQGGLALARDPADIGLGAVVRRCEPDMNMVECFDEAANRCALTPACALAGIMGEARDALLAVFDRYTLADIAIAPARLNRLLAAL